MEQKGLGYLALTVIFSGIAVALKRYYSISNKTALILFVIALFFLVIFLYRFIREK